MITDDQVKYMDVCFLCDVLEIDAEDILAAFPEKVDEHWDELVELTDRE